jgi:hypothetical protein
LRIVIVFQRALLLIKQNPGCSVRVTTFLESDSDVCLFSKGMGKWYSSQLHTIPWALCRHHGKENEDYSNNLNRPLL